MKTSYTVAEKNEENNIDNIFSMNQETKDVKPPMLSSNLTSWVRDNIHDKIEKDETVPEKYRDKVPYIYKLSAYILAASLFVIILVYFTYIGYVSDQSTKYISLDSTTYWKDNSSPYRQCNAVTNSITGVWNLDKNGYWEGMYGFLGGYGKYIFTFYDFQTTYSGYNSFMIGVKNAINSIGTNATTQTAAQNLAYLMSWAYIYNEGDYDQRVTFNGDPAYVFNRFYKSASMGSQSFPCRAIPTINLERATGIMTVQYDYGTATEYDSSKSTNSRCVTSGSGYVSASTSISGCGGSGCCNYYDPSSNISDTKTFQEKFCVIPPSDFGYSSAFDASHFTLKYNVWSLITAYSVNQGIINYSALQQVEINAINNRIGCFQLNSECGAEALAGKTTCSKSAYGLSYDDATEKCSILHPVSKETYYMSARVDVRYHGMEPIICMIKEGDTVPTVCLLRMGNAFVYPFFSHMGTSKADNDFYSWKDNCYCKKPSVPETLVSFYDATMYSTNINGEYKGQYDGYCNMFDLIHGFIIFKSNYYENHLIYNIILANEFTASEIDFMSYYAGFMQIRLGGNAAQNPQSGGQTSASDLLSKLMSPNGLNSLSFCTDLAGAEESTQCSIFAMNTYDEFDTRINADGAIAPYTSCINSFDIDSKSWDSGVYNDDDSAGPAAGDGAQRVPPTSLIQKYYECYNTIYSSLLFSFGSASGSAGTIQPFVMAIIVMISVRFFAKRIDKNLKENFEEENPRLKEIQLNINMNPQSI